MKTQIALLAVTALLIGCSSVSESIPTVKIEKRKPKAIVQSASFLTNNSANQPSRICETEEMRTKVMDDNHDNDVIRIMAVEGGEKGSRILSEVEIDCRDYFLRKSFAPAQPTIIRAAAPATRIAEPLRRSTPAQSKNYIYIVQRGDTVWNIAREHCTTAKAVSRLNGLGRGNMISIGQRLKLPDEDCK